VSKKAPFLKKFEIRDCAVCGERRRNTLYRQQFSRMADSSIIEGYDVVSCVNCGFVFADRLPAQEVLDKYYRGMSKYEFAETGGKQSKYDIDRLRELVEVVLPFIRNSNARIIDIGCSTGKLLSLLTEHGYSEVIGLDPSPGCAQTAEKLYGIKVLVGAVSSFCGLKEKFDCMILAGVLEHILDLRGVLLNLFEHLSDSGIICIQVPDASRFSLWPDAPFQQFSTEHINYFSSTSLKNLMEIVGIYEEKSVESVHPQSDTTMMPVVTSIFRKKLNSTMSIIKDKGTVIRLREYIRQSKQTENSIREVIRRLVANKTPLVVWGAGTHTLHLLESTMLCKADIRAFVDSNSAYHGKSLLGIPIISPEMLRSMSETVFVSSRVYQSDIVKKIHNELKLPNQVVTLYETDHYTFES
jgi:2-polyprenyl-3-methyl-5-hydroxy-6-metoxy-1,4-benzoquinol methylase